MQRVTWLGTSEALGSVTLGVYRVKNQEAGAGRAEEEDQEARGYTPHTWGSPDWPCKQRENAIPVGMGHPVRPALVAPAPLSLL